MPPGDTVDWDQYWLGGQVLADGTEGADSNHPSVAETAAQVPSIGSPLYNYNWNFKCDDDAPAPAPPPASDGSPVFNYNWNFCFKQTSQIKKGNCKTFGCIKAFDMKRIGEACQCFPGCDKTAFGDVCCPDYVSECEATAPAPRPSQHHHDAPTAAPKPLGTYTEYSNANCFSGHGAVDVGTSKTSYSESQCRSYCDADSECEGFVYSNWQECWKRRDINIPHCAANNGIFSTFVKTGGSHRPSHGALAYTKHAGKNCYQGAGAKEIGKEKAGSNSAMDCADYCDRDPKCNCFVVASFGSCFKRKNCRLQQCVASGGTFDTYIKQ